MTTGNGLEYETLYKEVEHKTGLNWACLYSRDLKIQHKL